MSPGPDSGPGGGRSGGPSMDCGSRHHPRPTPLLAEIGEDEGGVLDDGGRQRGGSKRKHRPHRDRDGDRRPSVSFDEPELPTSPPFLPPPSSTSYATSYTVVKDRAAEHHDGLIARRSETTKAILVPCALCCVFGPLCWLLGRHGQPLHLALWLSALLVFSIMQLRDRVRRSARLEADRLAFRRRVLQEDETAEWFCTIVHRLWQFHEPIMATKMRAAMAEKLEAVRPSRVQRFDIQRFTLGKKAPFFRSMRILTRSALDLRIPEDRIVVLTDMGFFAPDLEIVILARTSFGTVPTRIANFWLQGKMRMEIDLVPHYPHMQTMAVTFLDTPICDFDIQPLGVNLMEVPYIASILQKMVVNSINESLRDPAKVLFHIMPTQPELEAVPCCDGLLFVTLIGVDFPTPTLGMGLGLGGVRSGKGGGGSGGGGAGGLLPTGLTEYFCKLQLGDHTLFSREVQGDAGKAQQQQPHAHPRALRWHQTFAFPAGGNVSASEALELQLKQTRLRASRTVASVKIPLEAVVGTEGAATTTWSLEGGPGTPQGGTITIALRFQRLPELVLERTQATVVQRVSMRTLSPVKNANAEAGLLKPTDHPHAGSLVVIVHKATDLASMDANGLSDPYCCLFYGERCLWTTQVKPKTLEPAWEQSREFTVFDVRRVRFTVRIFDMDNVGQDDALGDVDIDLPQLLEEGSTEHFGRSVTRVHKRWFRIRRPGPLAEAKDLTAADLRQQRKAGAVPGPDLLQASVGAGGGGGGGGGDGGGGEKDNYGFLCVSLLFRPLPLKAVPRSSSSGGAYRAALGNADEEVGVACCYGNGGGGGSGQGLSVSASAAVRAQQGQPLQQADGTRPTRRAGSTGALLGVSGGSTRDAVAAAAGSGGGLPRSASANASLPTLSSSSSSSSYFSRMFKWGSNSSNSSSERHRKFRPLASVDEISD